MERLRAKLKSESGASITYALLLFLVCAVLATVILVAATTSAGRIKNLAETDQRYYAVTSAAELLKDVFKEHPTVTKATAVIYNDSGTESQEETRYFEKKANEIGLNDFTGASQNIDAAVFPWRILEASTTEKAMNLSVSGTDFDNLLNVTIGEKLKDSLDESSTGNTTLEYTITDKTGSATQFSVKVIFDVSSDSRSYNRYPHESVMEKESYIRSVVERTVTFREIKIG